jgi:ABC-type Fe3+-hydroxamate transport system substrate-binding protein
MFGTLSPRAWSALGQRVSGLVALLIWLGAGAAHATGLPRIVSLNPSLTAILIAIDARESLVGVDDYSAAHSPEVAELPRVGGLFSPSLEAVVGLRPDRVIVVPSATQHDFRARIAELGIEVEVFENIRFDQVLENIRRLGELVDREAAAARRIERIESVRTAASAVTRTLAPTRVLLVVQRDPIYVVGRGSFIDEMLGGIGADNLAREFDDPFPNVAAEWVVARGPDVLIDLSPDRADALSYWSRWPSIPAVARNRIVAIDPALISMPGPDLDRAIIELARGLHGDAVADAIAGAVPR